MHSSPKKFVEELLLQTAVEGACRHQAPLVEGTFLSSKHFIPISQSSSQDTSDYVFPPNWTRSTAINNSDKKSSDVICNNTITHVNIVFVLLSNFS